ncbi:SusC/RagA family TonB-linked outer membrane protein [Bacteroidales bacterium]|nr:SusC/RagA family TonB-linked outer membrane protein [Bacteroidales bacterium]
MNCHLRAQEDIKSDIDADEKIKPLEEKIYQVAYGTRTKTMLTGAISVVSGDELAKSPVTNLSDAIAGRVNGLTSLKYTGNEPGWTNSSFYIRGLGSFGNGLSPLVIVDNIERSFLRLDPEEIESFVVLKDAAATANFGMRAANGAISITTKRGFVGKPEISFKTQFGLQEPTRLPKYLGSAEYVRYRNIALQNDGLPIPSDPRYNPDMYNGTQDPYIYANTDWYGEMLKNNAPQQMQRLSVRGGTDAVKYYVLLGYTNQKGLYNHTQENSAYNTNLDFSRYNIRSNIDVALSQYLSVGLDLAGRMETKRAPGSSASSIFNSLSKYAPTLPIKNEDASVAGSSIYRDNPYGLIAKSGFSDYYDRYLQGNITANQELDFWIKGLSANAIFGFDSYKTYARGKTQQFAVYQRNLDNTYAKFGENSELDLGFQQWDDSYSLMSTFIGGLAYANEFDVLHTLGADIKFMRSNTSVPLNNPDYRNQNLFGRFSYGFDKRYIAEFSYSYSGSENFIGSNRFAFYPVVSGAWIISNENFLKNNTSINFLKLRGSYGLVGNSDLGLGRFPYQQNYNRGDGYTFGSGFTNVDGSNEGRIYNPNISAEKSLNANLGIDMEFFNGKFDISFDMFRHDRSDIITTRDNTLSEIIGQALPYENLGSVLNKGLELSLTHKNTVGDFSYFAQANISYAKNKITYMEELKGLDPWLYRTAYSTTQQRGLQSEGFFASQEEIDLWPTSTYGAVKPGDIKYKDQNLDGIINDDDVVPLGKPFVPEWNIGLNLGIAYKNFDLNILFTGVANRSIFVLNSVFLGIQGDQNATATVYDAWQKGVNESTALYPRLSTETNSHNMRMSDVWMHNGEYIRLQNAEIGYNLPKTLLAKCNIKDLRVFVNGYNLLSFDHLKKFNISAEYPNAGVSTYPEMRVFNIGASLKF